MRHYYLGQGISLLSVSFYAILHHFYARNPALSIDVFPSLSVTSTVHIPLAISLTMTNYLTEWTSGMMLFVRHHERMGALRDDRRIRNLLPSDNSEGWTQVIRMEARTTSEEMNGKELNLDLGALDDL